jgi:hypothetical protein
MDTSILGIDLTAWVGFTAEALYIASTCMALLVIVLVSCLAVQVHPPHAAKRRVALH